MTCLIYKICQGLDHTCVCILQCQYFNLSGKLLLSKYYNSHVNVLEFRNLMTINKTVLIKLCKFIKVTEKGTCDQCRI